MEFTTNDGEIDIRIQYCAIREEVTNARVTGHVPRYARDLKVIGGIGHERSYEI